MHTFTYVFQNGIDICQLGVDQRKVNMLAIEYANKKNLKTPIILSHHMLMSLKGPCDAKARLAASGRGPTVKMSKSVTGSAIFMDDSREEVEKLIMAAYCTNDIVGNPVYEYIKYIIFRWFKNDIVLCDKRYTALSDIDNDFPAMNKKQLKTDVTAYINQILEPVRQHFEKPELKELADRVAGYRLTR